VTLEAHCSVSEVYGRSQDTSGKYCCTSPRFLSLLSCDARGACSNNLSVVFCPLPNVYQNTADVATVADRFRPKFYNFGF
jgi:hypothetical protein